MQSMLPNEKGPTRTKVSWSQAKLNRDSPLVVLLRVFMFKLCLQAQKKKLMSHGKGTVLHWRGSVIPS